MVESSGLMECDGADGSCTMGCIGIQYIRQIVIMYVFLKCLGCDSNSSVTPQGWETEPHNQHPNTPSHRQSGQQTKFSHSTCLKSEANFTSNSSAILKSQVFSLSSESLYHTISSAFIRAIKNKTIQQRKLEQTQFIKTYCFGDGPKFAVEAPWSVQYTQFLGAKTADQPRRIANEGLIENGRLKSGLKVGKDYLLVSQTVWTVIKYLYGGGPEIEKNKMLPILELSAFGLQNERYSCYFNAGFQALMSIPEFVDYFNYGHFKSEKHKTKHPSKTLSTLTYVTLKHLSTATTSDSFELGRLKKYIECRFPADRQHDCHQFLRFYISSLQEELNPIGEVSAKQLTQTEKMEQYQRNHTSIVDTLFCGQIVSEIKCGGCMCLSHVIEPIMEITLQMKSQSLADCLDHHFSPEKLIDLYECSNCSKQHRATRQLTFNHPPMYLMITLKRFLEDGTKKQESLEYYQTLDLSEYSKYPFSKDYQYTLQSVIIHSGEVNKGHYYILTERQGIWYLINDRRVKKINISDHLSAQAYILVYRQIL